VRHFWHAGVSALFILMAAPSTAQAATPLYRLADTVPLGGGVKWDYLHFQAASNQLFIAHGDELTVVDTARDQIAGNVTGLDGTHGITFDPATGLGYTDSSGTKTLSMFNPVTMKVQKTLPSLEDTDGMVYDPASHQIFVAAGDSEAALALNPATGRETKIALGGQPEYLAADGQGQIFLALNDKNEMAVVNSGTDQVTARWPLPGCDGPTGMAIDPQAQRVFTSCQNGKLAVLNTGNGQEVALLPIGLGSDSAAFDAQRHLIFSANSTGTLSIIKETDPFHYTALVPVKTRIGARTMAIDERDGDIFLVTATAKAVKAPKRTGWAPHYEFTPGTLTLLVYHQAAS